MPKKRAASVQLRASFPVTTVERLENMAVKLGVDVPNLMRMMIATQLVQWEAMYLHPQKFVDVASKVGGPAAGAVADQMAQEAADLATGQDDRQDRPGFRPAGRPRSFHELQEELVTVPGSEWSGYLRGL